MTQWEQCTARGRDLHAPAGMLGRAQSGWRTKLAHGAEPQQHAFPLWVLQRLKDRLQVEDQARR